MLAAMLHVPPLLAPLPVTSVRASILRASASDVDQALINREIAKTIEYLNELDSEALPSLRETIEELQLAKRCLQERTPTGYADGAVPPVALPSPPKVTRTYGADSAFAGTWSPSLLAPIFQSAVLLPKKGTLLVVAAFQKVIRTALTIAVLLGAVMLQVATVLQDAMIQIAIQIAEMARLEAEREAAQLAAERALAEAAAAVEAERLAAEAARLAVEKAEAERLAAEAERLAAEAAAVARAQRLAAEKAEAERIAAVKAEAERIAAERDGAAVKLQSSRRGRMGRRMALSYRIASALLPRRPHPHIQLTWRVEAVPTRAWCDEAVLYLRDRVRDRARDRVRDRAWCDEAVLSRGQRHARETEAATTIAAAHRGKAARKQAPGVVMKHPPKPPPLPATVSRHHVRPSKIDLDEGPDAPPIQLQIAAALHRNAGKVLDDEVSKKEFRKAMPAIGLDVSVREVDALFDSWDQDGGGVLHYKELSKVLRSPAPTAPPPTSVKQDLVSESREAAAATTIAAAHRGKAARKKAPGMVMKHPPKPRKAETQTRDTMGVFARESLAEAAYKQAVGVAESASKTAAAKLAEAAAARARAAAARAEAARTVVEAARAASVANAAAMAEAAAAKQKAAVREAAAKEAAAKEAAAKEAAEKDAAAAKEAAAKEAEATDGAANDAAAAPSSPCSPRNRACSCKPRASANARTIKRLRLCDRENRASSAAAMEVRHGAT